MSIDSHFIHLADIERAEAQTDAYNADVLTFRPWLADQRCRFVEKEQAVPVSVVAERPVLTKTKVLLPGGLDINQKQFQYQIVNVRYEDRTTEAGPFRVMAILPRRARVQRHLSLVVERV